MGTKGRALVKNADRVIELLNKAFVDEWLAYHQYWVGAKVIAGPMKDAVEAELVQHATEELGHADMVANRIIQLGGTPVTTPKKWFDLANCPYEEPVEAAVEKILLQNIESEQCAISVYHSIMEEVEKIDPITYQLALTILQDEVAHEDELQALQEDLEMMLNRMK